MGWAYIELIAAATLFNNPGVTREEFAELLNQTHATWMAEFKPDDPWSITAAANLEDTRLHRGLYGLAQELQLSTTSAYKEFASEKTDEHGLPLRPPFVDVIPKKDGDVWLPPKYRVYQHTGNILGKSERIDEMSFDRLKVGDVWRHRMLNDVRGRVDHIYKEECLPKEETDDYDEPDSRPRYRYDMVVTHYEERCAEKEYATLEKLALDWPQLLPDAIHDFSKTKGVFWISRPALIEYFRWMKRGDRYYLDEEATYDLVPITMPLGIGYVDLITTASALKHNAWKLFSVRGKIHAPAFFNDFPDAFQAYEKAVWDAHTSLYAKGQGMTIRELLIARCSHFIDVPPPRR
jgi:hypothetical protein